VRDPKPARAGRQAITGGAPINPGLSWCISPCARLGSRSYASGHTASRPSPIDAAVFMALAGGLKESGARAMDGAIRLNEHWPAPA